ncbi:MAG: 16S rRNA (guanine(966)-N(2))-methyltransferase RsmD [Gemmatimonadales bacterium]|nr:16S rRNA (guanine(966)-N(2))-methyltransferase RsmD [Gemmatimonadales bacterium]MDG2240169.1 16S rRNA (guanine(966)-N(2))-methyltransferase RsmD [Longimicrobiales bacterium]NCG33875.1 16S rRNA (guanine(966)-N(2))-methyltransferase RsmD [Pseudomonadota bacterium]MBT3773881.1 16S rRNA (guanine(966)-N(2))-methyltransferase RsmD [Gemmatimonadales bacterium]MBT3958242.1 16S rRNA (guanine(966)-N(2))-methyltransferase RsmD [Gemmatimonadales bacterium]
MRIIGGAWRGRRLKALKGKNVRPTTDRVREAWMSAMGGRFDGLSVLDLFSGSGALGLEALSRGAERVVFVEQSRAARDVIRANIELLGAEAKCRVVSTDVFRFLLGRPGDFDLAVADPPYATGDAAKLVAHYLESPFARELWLEHPSRETLDVPETARTRRYGDTALTTLSES